jgi:hypothetical protein
MASRHFLAESIPREAATGGGARRGDAILDYLTTAGRFKRTGATSRLSWSSSGLGAKAPDKRKLAGYNSTLGVLERSYPRWSIKGSENAHGDKSIGDIKITTSNASNGDSVKGARGDVLRLLFANRTFHGTDISPMNLINASATGGCRPGRS